MEHCLGLKTPQIRMAYREKIAICFLVLLLSGSLIFFLIGFSPLICPRNEIYSVAEINSFKDEKNPKAFAYGQIYDLKDVIKVHQSGFGIPEYKFSDILGTDVSNLFFKHLNFADYCPGLDAPTSDWDSLNGRKVPSYPHDNIDPSTGQGKPFVEFINRYSIGKVGWSLSYIEMISSPSSKLIVFGNNVYDVSSYFNSKVRFLGPNMDNLFLNFYGKDATKQWFQLKDGDQKAGMYLNCMNNLFYVGTIDKRNSLSCQFSNIILLTFTIIVVSLIVGKFLTAVSLGNSVLPENIKKYVVIQIPVFTESHESIENTINSVMKLNYDTNYMLMVIVVDGIVIGSGNELQSHKILMNILGIKEDNADPFYYESLGSDDLNTNRGKVYSGFLKSRSKSIKYILIVKCGNPSELYRPGNRGKRDSQTLLLQFLSRSYFESAMNPLELEVYSHLDLLGVSPNQFEYILMIDSDTTVLPNSLKQLISRMVLDSKIIGLCGETLIENSRSSWVSMIQVYEYFISHHLSKSFESLFGSVTCLPGCFCMYRIKTPSNRPLIIAPKVLQDYTVRKIDTLHLKNLLLLGEDRYLTTLMMKHFPTMKLCFNSNAQCKTVVPDQWSVLVYIINKVSQRRRWINSTVHNLFELLSLNQLCGFCLCSMRFVVLFDLFSTLVQPAGFLYLAYLIYSIVRDSQLLPMVSMIMLGCAYGLQALIFLMKREWSMIGWMIIYMLAMPIFGFYIPLYAFYNMDCFEWGNTRLVAADSKNDTDSNPLFTLERRRGFRRPAVSKEPIISIQGQEKLQEIEIRKENLDTERNNVIEVANSTNNAMDLIATNTVAPNPMIKTDGPSTLPGTVPWTELRNEIRAIFATYDLKSLTRDTIIQYLEQKFGQDLRAQYEVINEMVDEFIRKS